MTEIATATASSPTPSGQSNPNAAASDGNMRARVEQDASRIMAAITPPTWSFINKVTGEKQSVTCMPGCDLDPSKNTDRPVHPEDICCQASGTTAGLPLYGPMCDGRTPEEFRVLAWQIDLHPFSTKVARRLPHVNIEAIDDHWIEDLDPDALATVIGQLQEQVDSLRAAHAQLVEARADYAAEQILTALRQHDRGVTA
jgi:hypothetical protein